MNDYTSKIEQAVNAERKPKLKHLVSLWLFVFKSTKAVSLIYLGLVLVLAIMRPAVALVWERYITSIQGVTANLAASAALVLAYFALNFLDDLIQSYTHGGEDIERIDIVQTNRMQEFMGSKLFSKLSRVSPEFFEVAKINDNVQQVFAFASDRYNGMSTTVMRNGFLLIGNMLMTLSVAATLYIFNPWLLLIVLITPIPVLWTGVIVNKLSFKFIKSNTQTQRKMSVYQGYMLSTAAKELLTLGLHDFIYKKWKTLADEYTINERKMYRTQTVLNAISGLLSTLVRLAANVLAVVLVALGQLSIGVLAAAWSLSSTLSQSMSSLAESIASLVAQKHKAAQFLDLTDLPEAERDSTAAGEYAVKCENLRYRYPTTEKYALDGVTLTIRKGEKVALVGENGAGKTTFVKLVTGMLSPSEGELSAIGGLSAVYQDSAQYRTFTVGDNVFLGDVNRERSERDIDDALEFAGFDGVGKDEYLGKTVGGTDLSGGQWQKLAIARAAYRNRDFIILDEPTGNLDPLAEAEVFKKYAALAEDKTVLFVTHRISAAALADRIIVFRDGKAAEDGTHEELIKQGGEYARLHREQSKWYR
jgi:ATP-binding cassette subfamily B protein